MGNPTLRERWAPVQEKRIHEIFVVSVSRKGLHALLEIALGLWLSFASTAAIVALLDRSHVRPLLEFAGEFTPQSHHFYAFYLLSHGVLKVALVAGLLARKLWAYPASFVVFGLFIVYQLYRYSSTHDLALILLSIFDLFVIWLAVHEYRLLRQNLRPAELIAASPPRGCRRSNRSR